MYRIMYISNGTTLGGAEQSLIDTLKIVIQKNIYPIVVIPGHGMIETRLEELGINYYIIKFECGYSKIGTCSKEKEDINFYNNFYAAQKLQRIIQEQKIELVHINSSTSNVGAMAALLANIPYVWHFREFLEEDFGTEFWDRKLKQELVLKASCLIAISEVVANSYKQKYNFDMVRVYNGIDSDRYKQNIEECDENKNSNNFIITGMITENKGQWDAIKAIHCLVNEGVKNIHLTIIGKGTDRFLWIINRYIKNNNLENYIDIKNFQKELSSYRKNSQYAITTSKMEALGRCTIESMFVGNIVIGADTGGTLEIIGEDEKRGFLYRQGDYKNLATVMKRVIKLSSDEKRLYRNRAQKYVENQFSLVRYGKRILEIYGDAISHYSSRDTTRKDYVDYLKHRYEDIASRIFEIMENKQLSKYDCIISNWEKVKSRGFELHDYLRRYEYKKVAIYGMGNLGFRVCEDLLNSEIDILYVVDRNSLYIEEILKVIHPEELLPDVDLLIVAVAEEEKEIIEKYKGKYKFPIIGITEILYEFSKKESERT